jgi:hypothetical protein
MRTRNHEELHADILDAHYSAALCHLGNISYRLGKEVPGTTSPNELPDNQHAQESWEYIRENLKAALGLDLDNATYTLGPKLAFDPEKEKFVDSVEADQLLTRDYRKPYVVTEEV